MKRINVTQPSLPSLEKFQESLAKIWDSKWLTNNGQFHQDLEKKISEYLGVPHVSLFNNGMIALQVALQSLRVTGEVITTPYSFVATAHALKWNGCTPVFADIDPITGNLDPASIESLITPQTTAILPVHVYGSPCETNEIQKIADTYGLKVIYDAAHAFGVKKDGESILTKGDVSMVSFHATKAFNTIEGGLLVLGSSEEKKRVDYLKNFGIEDEDTVVGIGTNGKMNELIAAYGLLQLENIDHDILKRKKLTQKYKDLLSGVDGLSFLEEDRQVRYNYSYMPIFINESEFPISRDDLYEKLKSFGYFGRKYFYPLISDFSPYKGLASAKKNNLPNAHKMANSVICLPLFSEMNDSDLFEIVKVIKGIK